MVSQPLLGEHLVEEQGNLDLFQRVAEFNLYLARYIHSSWLTNIEFSPLIIQLGNSGNADFHLSQYLLEQFDLAHSFDYDFQPPVKRIALVDENALCRLALYLGIILHEESIRNVVRRQERLALEECLGKEAYRFAVKKAQFVGRASDRLGPSLLIDWEHLDRFKAFLETSGHQVMDIAFSNLSEAFRQRLVLKLPSHWQESLEQQENLSLSVAQCMTLVLKTHKEANREWRHLLS